MAGVLQVRAISEAAHLAYVAARPSVSFLQTPAWGRVKPDWTSQSIGWFPASSDEPVGAGLVLYRRVPGLPRGLPRHLAYLPEGPDIPWAAETSAGRIDSWLDPLVAYLKTQHAFAVRLGPPVPVRSWDTATLKAALASGSATRLDDLPPSWTDDAAATIAPALAERGWRPEPDTEGFATGQPRHVFQLPLAGRDEDDVFAGFNQLWRRNVRKAAKVGVEVSLGTRGDLDAFHALYLETAHRDGFTPRPLSYFRGMWDAMTAEDAGRLQLYLARHDDDLVAATTMVKVGTHAWYSYGASSGARREVRGSNAVQWRMITDALAAGADVYDLRGITATLDPDDPHVGLIQFKLGTGGNAVEYPGEWTLPLNVPLFRAFELYLARRGS
jgi:lipid II:glycine glycyltransferase (peptidoglycan interpeptide bridge formation enzyme)